MMSIYCVTEIQRYLLKLAYYQASPVILVQSSRASNSDSLPAFQAVYLEPPTTPLPELTSQFLHIEPK